MCVYDDDFCSVSSPCLFISLFNSFHFIPILCPLADYFSFFTNIYVCKTEYDREVSCWTRIYQYFNIKNFIFSINMKLKILMIKNILINDKDNKKSIKRRKKF